MRVYREIVRFNPSVIHQHWATWSAPAVVGAHRLGVPLILSMHGYDAFLPLAHGRDILTTPIKILERSSAIRAAATVVVNSNYMAKQVVLAGVQEHKIRVIPHGVDTEFFRPADITRAGVLFVGRLSPEKGLSLLLHALALTEPGSYDQLTVVGSGQPKARRYFATLADRLGVPVRFMGLLDRDAVRDMMCSSRLLVVPSVPRGRQHEASGIVQLEAQACGTPVIVTSVGGLPESVAPSVRELTAAPECRALSDSIREILGRDAALLSLDARAHVVKWHSLVRVQTSYRDLYREHDRCG